MRIQLTSDAHLNMGDSLLIAEQESDVLVLAGDMFSSPKAAVEALEAYRRQTSTPVVYVLGNHEHYGHILSKTLGKYRKALESIADVHLLEKQSVVLDGVTFLGTTLWSNLSDPMAALVVSQTLVDYEMIELHAGQLVNPQDLHAEHVLALNWLKGALAKTEGPTVVVTHHAPLWECRNTYYDYDNSSQWKAQGFCNRLDTLIYKNDIDYWLYGHTHKSFSARSSGTRVVSNQVGRTNEAHYSGFNRQLVLEL